MRWRLQISDLREDEVLAEFRVIRAKRSEHSRSPQLMGVTPMLTVQLIKHSDHTHHVSQRPQ